MRHFIITKRNGLFIVREVQSAPTRMFGPVRHLHQPASPTEAECEAAFNTPLPTLVPASIANWRCKAVLKSAGLFEQVEAYINALPSEQKVVVETAWNSGADVLRNSPMVAAIGLTIGLTDAQIDAMFIQAQTLIV